MTTDTKHRPLTAKQEAFCLHIYAGKTQHDAYKLSYDCSNMVANSIDCEASQLMDNPLITQRLEQLRNRVTEQSVIANVQERKKILTEIARATHETPLTAGQRIAAAKELNLMERVYETQTTVNMVVIPDAQAKLLQLLNQRSNNMLVDSAQSTQSPIGSVDVPQIEAKS